MEDSKETKTSHSTISETPDSYRIEVINRREDKERIKSFWKVCHVPHSSI